MTEPNDDARAEQALREAFAQRADEFEPSPLRPTTRRGRWWVVGAVAASVAIAAVGIAVVVGGEAGDVNPDPPAVASDPPPASPSTSEASAPATREVSYRNLVVEVPEEWVDEPTPNGNGCGYPSEPFVAVQNQSQTFPLNLCLNKGQDPPSGFPRAKLAEWSPNLQLSDVRNAAESLPDGQQTYEGWTLTRRTVDLVRIEVLTDAATDQLVDPILDSARTTDRDPNGCATSSPAQAREFVRPPAFDVTQVRDVTSIGVCLYDRLGVEQPGLHGSRTIKGEEAQTVLESIQAAPEGGGPDKPQNCIDDEFGSQVLVLDLAFRDALRGSVYVYFEWCFGNGFDDGTTRRALTEAACAPLWGGRVQQYGGSSEPFRVCHPAQR